MSVTYAIVVAGGSGERMGGAALPKQFMTVGGRPVIAYTLQVFDAHEEIDSIILVCRADFLRHAAELIKEYGLNKVTRITPAGSSRQESVLNGLLALKELGAGEDCIVLVHDAVRPMVSGRIISDSIKAAREHGAANTVIPAEDTIAKSSDGLFMDEVPTRNELFYVQTPQSFKLGILWNAHTAASAAADGVNATDDCKLALKAGYRVALVAGEKRNFKITTWEDLALFEALLNDTRKNQI